MDLALDTRPSAVDRIVIDTSDLRPAAGQIDIPSTGLTVRDDRSGTTVFAGTPLSTPDVWLRYIDGARRSYAAHGISGALDFDAVVGGEETSMFFAVITDDDEVVGGVRVQGPYRSISESHALIEWDGTPGLVRLSEELSTRLGDGLAELKTAFVNPHPAAGHIAAQIARVPLFVQTLAGCRYTMATAADHVLSRWESGGGRVNSDVPPTPYPDDRYRTQVMFWDRLTMAQQARPDMWALMQRQCSELMASATILGDNALVAA
ncbi:hypothetical protein [Williamsia sterculiae]|uniref:N-acetyltransferase domain-containing protein n=1 Tax=Williamsia sterculiae TaxID=1344003 RepID=A0A1N7CIS1_9NOCA|nr:hypothetical protein [Williamsia sterculiae]SIR63538.1 hypothetical protein SAMN05445060_0169 [Williamsia sterculiae]